MMPSIFQNRAIDEWFFFFVPAALIHNGSEDEIEHFIINDEGVQIGFHEISELIDKVGRENIVSVLFQTF